MKTIAILIPLSWTHVPSEFFLSFMGMFSRAKGDFNPIIISSKCSYLDYGREQSIEMALGINPDYIMWIDADQVYQEDTIARLAKHIDDGMMVVNGVTPHKENGKPMEYEFRGGDAVATMIDGFQVNRGLVKVDVPGGGGQMMNPRVYSILSPPYYIRTEADPPGMRIGEDVLFFWKLKQAGVESWVDTDLHFGHIVNGIINVTNGGN